MKKSPSKRDAAKKAGSRKAAKTTKSAAKPGKARQAPGKWGAVFLSTTVLLLALIFIVLPYMYSAGAVSIQSLENYDAAIIELIFPSITVTYLLLRGWSLSEVPRCLGLSEDKLNLRMVLYGVILFLAIFAFEVSVGMLQGITGVQINTNVGLLLAGTPLWFLAFVAFVGPVCEEILFRGLLVPRIGIVLSAAIFGLLHYGYGSTLGIDIIAAFIFGVIAGYTYKKTGSLYPSILAHILVNLLAVIAFSAL